MTGISYPENTTDDRVELAKTTLEDPSVAVAGDSIKERHKKPRQASDDSHLGCLVWTVCIAAKLQAYHMTEAHAGRVSHISHV